MLSTRVSFSFPNVPGDTAKVYEIPSCECWNGNLATDAKAATAPFWSRPFIGLAPGANGVPSGLPSGVAPVFLPYTTFEVIVKIDCVGIAFLYVSCWRRYSMNFLVISTAIASVRSSLFPKGTYSPSRSKSTAMPLSSRITFTFVSRIAASESATIESPAIPVALIRCTSPSCRAISNASYAYLSCM